MLNKKSQFSIKCSFIPVRDQKQMGVTRKVLPLVFAIQMHLWKKLQGSTLTGLEFEEVLFFFFNAKSCIKSLHLSPINGFHD